MRRGTFNIATQRYSDESNGEKEEREEKNRKYAAERQQSRKQHEDQIPRSQRSAREEHNRKPAANHDIANGAAMDFQALAYPFTIFLALASHTAADLLK